ncbi:hypothetical protein IFM89_009491, partial [Coptis chinensis]
MCRNWNSHAHLIHRFLPGKALASIGTVCSRNIDPRLIWAYAHLLIARWRYKHRPKKTQMNLTDKAYLISSHLGRQLEHIRSLRLASATPPPLMFLAVGIGILLDGLFGTGTGRLYCVYYGPNPMATRIDYIVEFTVAVPILILLWNKVFFTDGEHVVQVYCGQTQAIQQYALELSQCLPPTPETTSLEKSDSGVYSKLNTPSSDGFGSADSVTISDALEMPTPVS